MTSPAKGGRGKPKGAQTVGRGFLLSLKKLLVPTAEATAAELADATQASMQAQVVALKHHALKERILGKEIPLLLV